MPKDPARAWPLDLVEMLAAPRWPAGRGRSPVPTSPAWRRGRFTLDPARREDWALLLAALREDGRQPDRIVHLLNVTGEDSPATLAGTLAGLPDSAMRAFDSLLVARPGAWSPRGPAPAPGSPWCRATCTGWPAMARPGRKRRSCLGPVAVIPQEIPGLSCRSIDLTDARRGMRRRKELVDDLLAEIDAGGDAAESVVAWRDGERWVRRSGRCASPSSRARERRGVRGYAMTASTWSPAAWAASASTLAEELAAGRESSSPCWGGPGCHRGRPGTRPCRRGADRAGPEVRELEAAGAEVLALAADVTDEISLAAALAEIEARLGPVRGVVHAAGLPGGRLLQLEDGATAEPVLAPKVRGTLILHALLAGRALDFFFLCSSINGVIGGFGQAGYAAANAFLDAFATATFRRRGPYVVSVGWDRWEEVGMAARSPSLPFWQGNGAPEHPLLDALVERSAEREVWATELRVERHWVLSEHLIVGHPTLPGTTYLEMARAAFARRAGGRPVELREVVFLAPLVVLAGQRREVRTILEGSGTACEFRIMSRLGQGWQEHARGQVGVADVAAPEPLDLEALLATCKAGEVTERRKAGDFLVTGARWQSLRRIHLGEGVSVAELELGEEFAAELASFGLHPALLDVAAGVVQILGDGDFLPLTYDRLTVHAGPARRSYSYFRLRGVPGEVLSCDITLLDEAGRVLAEIEGFSMRRVGREAAEQLRRAAAAAPAAVISGTGAGQAADAAGRRAGDGILPYQGAQLFRRILRDGALPHLVVSTRELPAVVDAARAFGRERLAERLNTAGATTATHVRPDMGTPYAPPTEDLEQQVAVLWERVLGIERVGIHDNFFELGGTSLTGIQLVTELKKQLGVNVPTVSIFQAPTVSALVRYLKPQEQTTSEFDRSRSRAEKKKQALAQAQRAARRRRA